MSELASLEKTLEELNLTDEDEDKENSNSSTSTEFQLELWLSDTANPKSPTKLNSSDVEDGTVRIVKLEDVYSEMQSEIKEAAQLTFLSPTSVRILLNSFQWDKAKMLEQTLYGESFLHLRDVGIIINPVQSISSPIVPIAGMINHHGGICLVCRNMTNIMSMVFTACSHWICVRCFHRHLIAKIERGERSHFQCPFVFCSMFLDDDTVLQNIPPHLMESYRRLCVKDFVIKSKYRRKCPIKGCNRTCWYDVDSNPKVKKIHCDCGADYCFGCGAIWHFPLSCGQI